MSVGLGAAETFSEAYLKSQLAAGDTIPNKGTAFLSVRDADKAEIAPIARDLIEIGFELIATRGTGKHLQEQGIEVRLVNKVAEGRPHIVDALKNDEVDLIVNTTEGKQAIADSYEIRRTALQHKVYNATTMAGARACIEAVRHGEDFAVHRLQDLHKRTPAA